jgi:hypothetical protein
VIPGADEVGYPVCRRRLDGGIRQVARAANGSGL